jgi:putative photosynthetic complex assembly protein
MATNAARVERFPRGPLMAAGGMVALALTCAVAGRVTGAHVDPPVAQPVAERDLRFVDRSDGGIDVFDARDNRTIETVLPGTNGFIRALMRGLATERKHEGYGPEAPFRLGAWSDGRLTLEDPATGRHVELAAFGASNAGAFAQLLADGSAAR